MQDGDGVVIEILPAARGKFLKDFLRFLVPGPPEIAGKLVQPVDQFRHFFAVSGFVAID